MSARKRGARNELQKGRRVAFRPDRKVRVQLVLVTKGGEVMDLMGGFMGLVFACGLLGFMAMLEGLR